MNHATPQGPLPLDDRAVHIWCATLDAPRDPSLVDQYLAWLSDDERQRHARFFFDGDRQRYLLGTALARWTLSRYVPLPCADWVFAKNEFGRPEIDQRAVSCDLRFNLSRTGGLVACAVTRRRNLGLDVEDHENKNIQVDLAEQFLSPRELADLHALNVDARRGRFFDLWTLKEAYVKARGRGLSLPLDQFSMRFAAGQPLAIDFTPEPDDRPDDWQFRLFRPSSRHTMALAIQDPSRERVRVSAWDCVPLVSQQARPLDDAWPPREE